MTTLLANDKPILTGTLEQCLEHAIGNYPLTKEDAAKLEQHGFFMAVDGTYLMIVEG